MRLPFSGSRLSRVLVLTSVAACAGTANAQWSGALGSSWNHPTSASISRILVDRLNQRLLSRRLAPKSQQATASGAEAPAAATRDRTNTAVRFHPVAGVVAVPGIAGELGGTADEQRQTTAMLVGILDTWNRETAANGYPNDLALAFASFIAMSCAASRDRPLPPDDRVIELRDAIAEIALETGAFEKADNRQRQQMYEVLVIFGNLAYTGFNAARESGDTAAAEVYRQLADQNIRTVLGLDPNELTFDGEGLRLGRALPADEMATPPAVSARDGAVAAELPAGDLVRQFEDNEIRASQLYGGKRVRVVGLVNSIDAEPAGRASLTFRSSASSYGMLKCVFERPQVARLAQVGTSDQVAVEGTVRGLGGGWNETKAFVVLENCAVR